ncbi:MAG TPA: hypothetical protein VKZ65_03885, partial [Glycomyces sp.]|nr:hypothetical protein [Glycomyces sp.]
MGPAQEQSGIADALAQALQVVKEGQQAQEESAGQEVEVKGAGGQILVTATLAGKLNVRIVDPRAFRLGVEEL